MKSYHFDIGNSNDGPLGMCARISANSREEALERLRGKLEFVDQVLVEDTDDEYIALYVNEQAIVLDDIDDWEEEE